MAHRTSLPAILNPYDAARCALCEDTIRQRFPFDLCAKCAFEVYVHVQQCLNRIDEPAVGEVIQPQPVAADTAEVVYYARFADRVKIGTTQSLTQRLRAIPHDEVLAVEAGGVDVERARHEQFAALRLGKEWFSYTGSLVTFIERLHDMATA